MRWALKIAAKLLLSRLHIPYDLWRRLGLFRHGRMDTPQYVLRVFRLHSQRALGEASLQGKTILEIGPGDSLASVLVGCACGAKQTILVDVGAFARHDIGFYQEIADGLRQEGLAVPDIGAIRSVEGLLSFCNGQYLTEGLKSFAGIETGTVDFLWSHSVLEHIPKAEIVPLFKEFRRILRPDGLMSHNIDYQDHLERSLNSLRFSESVWETPLFRNSGFYTNRVRALDLHRHVREAGFTILDEGFGKWPDLPVAREKLDPMFREAELDNLLIRTSCLLARPSAS